MTPNELWKEYCKTSSKEELLAQVPEAWSFGVDADRLADLVARGIKTATSSAHALYALLGEELPIAEGYDIIVNCEGEAVCIIETTKVYVTPFSQVSAHHAWKEGEYRPLATEKRIGFPCRIIVWLTGDRFMRLALDSGWKKLGCHFHMIA